MGALKASLRKNYWSNLGKLAQGNRMLDPLAVTFFVTTHCNLNCVYCEDFGARRNAEQPPMLPLDQAKQVLGIIREGTDALILTGGEPLLYPQIDELVRYARYELAFRHITMLTNGYLLDKHPNLLKHLDRVVISLDAVDPAIWHQVIGMPLAYAQRILANITQFSKQQAEMGFQLVLNCVLTSDTLAGVEEVLAFCQEHHLLVSFSPQAVDNWPDYHLLVADAYRATLQMLMTAKLAGAPILGSMDYLNTLFHFQPYSCYPLLVPRVMPNGDLVYPCRPIEKDNGAHGGRPANLLKASSWKAALAQAEIAYGEPPQVCTSCFQQCYAETSLMQQKPLALLEEILRYPASRRGQLLIHAPG